jgi:hypothetical protein
MRLDADATLLDVGARQAHRADVAPRLSHVYGIDYNPAC